MGVNALIASLVIATGSTAASIQATQNAAKQSNRAAEAQRKQQELAAARERANAIRQARMAYAANAQGAETAGASMSSASMGGLGSIQSQLNSNISFLDKNQQLADQGSIALGKMRSAEANASSFGAVAGLAMQTASLSGSGAFDRIFKSKPKPPVVTPKVS